MVGRVGPRQEEHSPHSPGKVWAKPWRMAEGLHAACLGEGEEKRRPLGPSVECEL